MVEDEAALILGELAVEEIDRQYSAADVTAVVAQLLRSAVHDRTQERFDHDMREGRMTPEVAMATVVTSRGASNCSSRLTATSPSANSGSGFSNARPFPHRE